MFPKKQLIAFHFASSGIVSLIYQFLTDILTIDQNSQFAWRLRQKPSELVQKQ